MIFHKWSTIFYGSIQESMVVKNILRENQIDFKEKFENQSIRMGLAPGLTTSRDYIKTYVEIMVPKDQVSIASSLLSSINQNK